MEQPEVGEAQHNGVELHKDGHHLEVHLLAGLWLEGVIVRHNPSDLLALDLRLEVVALDRDEDLAQGLGGDHIVQELDGQAAAEVRLLPGNQVQRGEGAEQEEQRQAVIQILQGINEGGIALLDNVIEFDFGEQGQATLQIAEILDGTVAAALLGEDLRVLKGLELVSEVFVCLTHLVVTQRPHYGLVQQEPYVLGVVQDLDLRGSLLCPTSVFRLSGIDALENAQPAEIVQRQLQFPESSTPANILRGLAGLVLKVAK